MMELLVVLAVLGLLTVFGAPVLMGLLPSFAVNAQARTLASAMRDARVKAILENDEVVFTIDTARERYGQGTGDASTPVSNGIDLRTHSGSPGVTELSFFPDGTSTGGRIDLVMKEHRQTLIVEKFSGDVSIIN